MFAKIGNIKLFLYSIKNIVILKYHPLKLEFLTKMADNWFIHKSHFFFSFFFLFTLYPIRPEYDLYVCLGNLFLFLYFF